MPREVVLFDFVMPALVPLFFLCIGVMWRVDHALRRLKVYSRVAHPPLFRLAVFVIVFCSLGLVIYD